ncbi:3-oxosteroid 1-dehydrogenase, partial [Klebsiella pneumoniae]
FAAGALAARYRPHTREHFTMSPPANDGAALHLAAALNAREGAIGPPTFLGAGIGADPGRRQRGALPPSGNRSRKTGRDCRQSAGGTLRQRVQFLSPFRQRNAGCSGKCPLFFTLRRPGDEALWPRTARPAPVNNDALVAAGYLHKADTLAALAQQLGLDAQTLSETVARYNRDAAQGVDREFAKGGNSYNRAMGDPGHQPDACNAPLLSAPFYAIKLYTGDLGTSRGLVTTADAQVVNTEGHPIPGLYAVGNDMDSLMAGTYPGPGITLGPGLTFGYLAACHLAQHSTH